jgi:uncharacterized protein (TIGR00255 family)
VNLVVSKVWEGFHCNSWLFLLPFEPDNGDFRAYMIASMTGYGRGEASSGGVSAAVELRSVNSRFLEVAARLPRTLSLRENDIKEQIRKLVTRGKVAVTITISRESDDALPLRINTAAARSYYKLLTELRKAVKLKEKVTLDHLLRFSEVLEAQEIESTDEDEWRVAERALGKALEALVSMKANEGAELRKDFESRIALIDRLLSDIERLSKDQIPQERERLRARIQELLGTEPVDQGRLELELAVLADRLDITEECVRFRSHNKFFLGAMLGNEPAGRKLNFLVQEMNREANTMGAKSSSPEIAHLVVNVKEELEKIREQLQNIE